MTLQNYKIIRYTPTISQSQSSHTLPHPQARGGDVPADSRRPLLRCVAGGQAAAVRNGDGKRDKCRGIRNRDSPSDRRGILFADNFRQTDCYAPQTAIPQSAALFAAIRRGTPAHCPCPRA